MGCESVRKPWAWLGYGHSLTGQYRLETIFIAFFVIVFLTLVHTITFSDFVMPMRNFELNDGWSVENFMMTEGCEWRDADTWYDTNTNIVNTLFWHGWLLSIVCAQTPITYNEVSLSGQFSSEFERFLCDVKLFVVIFVIFSPDRSLKKFHSNASTKVF